MMFENNAQKVQTKGLAAVHPSCSGADVVGRACLLPVSAPTEKQTDRHTGGEGLQNAEDKAKRVSLRAYVLH